MVRRGELACRNGWDEDLWTPKLQPGERSESAGGEWLVRPETPATGEELAAVARLRPAPEPPPPVAREDVVVGQGPVMPSPDDRVGLLAYDTHTALLEARERARRRQAAQAAAASAAAAPPATDAATSDAGGTSPGTGGGESASLPDVVAVDDNNRPDSNHGAERAQAEAEAAFDQVPEAVADIELPVAQPRPSRLRVASGEAEADAAGAPPWHERPAGGVDMRRHRLLQEVLERRSARGRPSADPMPESPLHDWPTNLVESGGGGAPAIKAPERTPQDGRGGVAGPDAVRDDRGRHGVAPGAPARRAQWNGDALEAAADAEVWDVPAVDYVVDEPDDAGFDGAVDVAPEIPRMCRTCRDFRPAEAGDRGWCTNTWAFSHRRMVYEDELPCLTSLGCWWLPHDDVWLAIADISAHSQPTPLVDRWLNEEGASVGGMRGRVRAKR